MRLKVPKQLPFIYLGVGAALTAVLWLLRPAAGVGISGAVLLLFWALHVAIVLPILYGTQSFLGRFSLFDRAPPITSTVLAGVIGSGVFTPFAIGLDALFAAPNDTGETGSEWRLWVSEFASFVFPVALVWILLNARALSKLSVPHLIEEDAKPQQAELELSEAEREFWNRMPKALGKNIVAVSAELHYLRVYTTLGDTLLLFGFGRSIEVLERFDGMQVHRSHWVAIPHVADLIRSGRALRCKLTNGTELPVSRAYEKALKDRTAAMDATELLDLA